MKIAYTVRCAFTHSEVAEKWLDWLRDGHLKDVCDAGAESALAVKLDSPDSQSDESSAQVVCEARYIFESREAFNAYERDHAPRLREEGLALFPLNLGLTYSRSVGTLEASV